MNCAPIPNAKKQKPMPIQKFHLKLAGRTLHLCFELDSEFYSDQVLAQILPQGVLPEPEVINALPHLVSRGDTVVDAGANIGFFTIILSKLVGTDGTVIAIEPDPRNRKKLLKNLDINGCPNVIVYEHPLAEIEEERKFYIQGENGSSTLYDGADPGRSGILVDTQMMHVRTLSDIIGDTKPTFLKMDIEGAELEAMKGCHYRFPAVIAEMNTEALGRAGTSIEKFRFWMETIQGYDMHILSETGSMPAKIAGFQRLVPTKQNANVLFAKEWNVARAWPEVKI